MSIANFFIDLHFRQQHRKTTSSAFIGFCEFMARNLWANRFILFHMHMNFSITFINTILNIILATFQIKRHRYFLEFNINIWLNLTAKVPETGYKANINGSLRSWIQQKIKCWRRLHRMHYVLCIVYANPEKNLNLESFNILPRVLSDLFSLQLKIVNVIYLPTKHARALMNSL